MRVLMLSIDDTSLLGEQSGHGGQGDTIKRHRRYGRQVDKLDIVVTSQPGYRHEQLSGKVDVYPTNAHGPWGHLRAVLGYAESFVSHDGIDLVVAQDMTAPAAWLIKKRFKVPYIVTFHAADWGTPDWKVKWTDRLALPLIKYAIRQADGLRVVSVGLGNYFAKQGIKCPIKVIPTASDYLIFTKPHEEEVKNIRAKYDVAHLLLTNGRLEKVKNYPLLFQAFSEVIRKFKSSKLLIIGSGTLEKELKQLARDMKLQQNIEFLGSMPYSRVVPYYQACDVFVLASDSESLGKVLLEAGAAGKPVVATKTLGTISIVKEGETGYLAETGDADGLTDKIMELLRDEKLSKQMGEAAREHVFKSYDAEKNIKRFVNFWQRIAKSKNK